MRRTRNPHARLGRIAALVTAVAALGCGEPTALAPGRGDLLPLPATTRITGLGAFLPPGERLEFDFNITDAPGGRIVITWYASYPPPWGVERLTVDPSDAATQIVSFTRTSAACVEVRGIGRLDITQELKVFVVDACDNANPGVGFDTFTINVPSDNWVRPGTLTEGDIAIGAP
jgi:hypothetical protein